MGKIPYTLEVCKTLKGSWKTTINLLLAKLGLKERPVEMTDLRL